tara:strand:+ start:258 stop:434 length:177 start_codon:yes stop_codon:yes gene_type:complete
MIKNLTSILILILSLSHCSSTDYINLGAAVFSGMEDKPNPVGAIKMIIKKDKKNKKDE